jgi:hypothetical protein
LLLLNKILLWILVWLILICFKWFKANNNNNNNNLYTKWFNLILICTLNKIFLIKMDNNLCPLNHLLINNLSLNIWMEEITLEWMIINLNYFINIFNLHRVNKCWKTLAPILNIPLIHLLIIITTQIIIITIILFKINLNNNNSLIIILPINSPLVPTLLMHPALIMLCPIIIIIKINSILKTLTLIMFNYFLITKEIIIIPETLFKISKN